MMTLEQRDDAMDAIYAVALQQATELAVQIDEDAAEALCDAIAQYLGNDVAEWREAS